MKDDDMRPLFESPLPVDVVIAILANDLPHMTEAQLAELLTNLYLVGPSELSDAIVPLARAEMARRRFISMVESIALAA